MKVLLIFPPLWIPYRPYLSLPSLSAYLKSNSIDVVQKDFNVEAYDLLLSETYLKSLDERLQSQFAALDSMESLSGIEQKYYYDIYHAKSSVKYIAERIEKAKDVFRSKNAYYDINALYNARSILKQAQIIISTGCLPTGQDLMLPVNRRFQRSLDDINKITQNKKENPYLELYEDNLLPFILEQSPDVIGISISFDGQLMPALTMSRLIKSSYDKAHVVVGGHIITVLSDILMKYKEIFNIYFDSAVINEGERPLLKLVENISLGKALEDVPNLIYFNHGEVYANEILPSEDINSLPTPCFDGLPFGLYLSPELVLPILSSRGCYWGKCAFCSDSEFYRCHYQCRDANKVADDIQELSQKYGVGHFSFSDEALSPSSISRLSDEFIKRGMKVRCSSNVRLERQFTPDLCKKIFKAGFRLLYFGLESGCNRILNHMNKGITKEIALEVCRNVYESGIWDHLYVIFGFPTESRAEVQETIDFLLSNKNIIHSFKINSFALDKNAPIMKDPEEYGITDIDMGEYTDFDLTYNYTVSSGLSSGEASELSAVYREKLSKEYKSKKFFKLDGDDMLLYISHFEKNDPYLRAVPKDTIKKIQSDKQITWKTFPKVKRNVVCDNLRFNLIDIVHNIANNENLVVYPSETYVIFDSVSEKLLPVDWQIMEILLLCDGKNSVQQIVHELSDKYNVALSTIEDDCVDSLKFLQSQGFIIF
jgi:anaerobic magnesium-protoporphyrin IX monomethyl ester cyclase